MWSPPLSRLLFPLSSADGQPSLLPPERVQQLNLRSTGMLNNVQRLFSHHMIHTFGCDYSTGGVTLDALQAKLRNFLEICTADGPRHDTYLVFYSGHTYKGTGAWALAGERSRNGHLALASFKTPHKSCGLRRRHRSPVSVFLSTLALRANEKISSC